MGKTMWARSLGKHMYMCNMFSLDKWDSDANYLVLDDIEWKFLPHKKQLLGGQKEFTVTDRYKPKRTVQWGKPCIYCINGDQYLEMANDPIWAWLQENCKFVFINNKLY